MQKKVFVKYVDGRLQSVEDLLLNGKLNAELVDDRLYDKTGTPMLLKDWADTW